MCLLDLVDYFLSHALGKFSAINSSNIFSGLLFLSSSGTPIMWMLVHLMLSQRSIRLSSLKKIFFSIFYSVAVVSTFLSSRSLTCFSTSVILLLILSSALFISVYLFFSSCRSLVNISCNFSIVCPRCWIMFTIIIVNYFSGRLPMYMSFGCFSGLLFCSFIWDIIFCFFILIYFLQSGFCSICRTVVLLASSVCTLMDEAKRFV